MALVTDRDLVVFEPNVFRDVAFTAQTRARTEDAALSGTVLTSASAQFATVRVDQGAVAVVDNMTLEVVERISETSLSVSVLRAEPELPLVPPAEGTGLSLRISSFDIQIAEAESRVTRSLGVDGWESQSESALTVLAEAGVVRLIALGTLELVYAAASSRTETSDPFWARSSWYGQRARAELRRVCARLDTDGDGLVDRVRRVQPARLVRE